MKHLLVRADANATIGTGHIMRCLALAQAWQAASGSVTFLAHQSLPDDLRNRLQQEGITVITHANEIGSEADVQHTLKSSQQHNSMLVLDGYNFGAEFQKIVAEAGVCSLVIDDYGHSEYYYADFVLNQNSYANEEIYKNRDARTQLLLGSDYALLRREFWSWRDWRRTIPTTAQNLLVTLGGGDPDNLTLMVLQAIQQLATSLVVTVVVGASNPHLDELETFIAQYQLNVTLLRNITDMPAQMAHADMALAAGGSTNWELCFMGLPTAITVIADNQRPIAEDLQDRGIAVNLGWHQAITLKHICTVLEQLVTDSQKRTRMSENGRKLVDAYGAQRVIEAIAAPGLYLRTVTPDDCQRVWEWTNEPGVRAASFSSDVIPWENHVQWFQKKLTQANSVFYIAQNQQNTPIGQVRFEVENNEATISVSLDAAYRGQGYGHFLIDKGARALFISKTDILIIHGYIKVDNLASRWAFEKAGFILKELTTYAGHEAFHMIRIRENQ